ncbi:MAG: iron-containing alcohol dehydrogenase [Candidatus Thorarchaeota archaeon]|nr:iron-containing alcohol dehydrogenase [Candidatus Thorarchaeota archaeon]
MVWWFDIPRVAFGEDALDELELVKGEKAVIITDGVINDLGYPDKIKKILESNGWQVTVWKDAEPDPRVSVAKSAAKAMEDSGADTIIAVGGGSVMDTAKAAWVLYANPDMNLEALSPFDVLGLKEKARLISIPTTAGTGSEITRAVVVREDESGRKFATTNPELMAELAILDPVFVKVLPEKMTIYTGMDALTHAVEGYISVWKNDFSDACSMKAIQMVFEWLPKSVSNLEDLEAREKMLVAAALAGMSFGNSQACLAHSMGHSMGSVLRLQHGLSVGMALPYTMEFSAHGMPDTARQYWELSRLVGIQEEDHMKATRALAKKIRELGKQIGFPQNFQEAGITREKFDESLDQLVEYAMMDSSITMTPRPIEAAEIRKIYEYMFDAKEVDF